MRASVVIVTSFLAEGKEFTASLIERSTLIDDDHQAEERTRLDRDWGCAQVDASPGFRRRGRRMRLTYVVSRAAPCARQ
jgi:hypothetical protein